MEPLMAIDRLEELIQVLYESSDVIYRLQLLAVIDLILGNLENTNDITGYTKEKIGQLRGSLRAMCGLNNGNGHDDRQQYVWAQGAIGALRSPQCFG